MSILNKFRKILFSRQDTDPRKAYDLWAAGYDEQPGNLMLDMDHQLFSSFLEETNVKGKTVADIGCGTGRHWNLLRERQPARMIGYDVSEGMLQQLKAKFHDAEVHRLDGFTLEGLADGSCDLVLSTLALAHIPDSERAIREWARVLRPGGEMIITDYHPQALREGGRRTFKHEGRLIAVKNYIHPIGDIRRLARQLHLREIRFSERVIDDSVREYYATQNALPLFERFKGVPMIYGIHLKKTDDPV